MRRFILGSGLAVLAAAIISSAAAAATYTISSATYPTVDNYTGCPAGDCQNFTTAMSFGGTATFNALPANLTNVDVRSYLTDFTLNDGLTTYRYSDPGVRIFGLFGYTNASGELTGLDMLILRWQDNGAGPHATGDRTDLFVTTSGFAYHNARCNGSVQVPDTCTAFSNDPSTGVSRATLSGYSVAPAPTVVPTLVQWAMVALAGLLGLAGLARAQPRLSRATATARREIR